MARGHRHDSRAEMSRAGDVVGRVADDDELLRLKSRAEMVIDSLRGQGRQVATIKRGRRKRLAA